MTPLGEEHRGTHLHLEDFPDTLALLAALFDRKRHDPVGLADIGYEATEHGAWADWEALTHSWLSSTEKAIVHIAHGCAILERHGGPPPRLNNVLRDTVAAVSAQLDLPGGWST